MGFGGELVSSKNRLLCLELVDEAVNAGARKSLACDILGVSLRTIQRWKHHAFDLRKGPLTAPANKLTTEERGQILQVANSLEYAGFTPWEIVAKLADKGIRTFNPEVRQFQLK